MNYNEFKKIFNDAIFEKSKVDLIRKIAEEPNRYIGLFRPTKPKAKILQNLLQSHEIRFGDAFETAIEKYLMLGGYEILQKRYIDEAGDALNVDQCFKKNESTYFVEQKIRDDHDSTKKRGQIDNFEKKLNVLISQYGENNMHGYFYFIDPDLTKNKNFYQSELAKMSTAYAVVLHLCYGNEFFDKISEQGMWAEIIQHLTL